MPKFSMSIFLSAYTDQISTNAPGRSLFRWNRDLQSCFVENGTSESLTIDPGTTSLLFSGVRTLLQDSSTVYSISLVPLTTNTYQLSAVGGTLPNFRTPRTAGANSTTQVIVTMNGPTATFTSVPGTFASFTGQITGMTTPVTITAINIGTAGNSVVLTADGTSSINTLISNWNTANPSNTIALTAGDGTQIPSLGTFAMYSGTPTGATTPIMITADNIGSVGNITLTGDGTSTIAILIANWNTANPSNTITFTSGINTQIPSLGATIALTGGQSPDTISLSGGATYTPFSLISGGVVVGDDVIIGSNFNSLNQGTFQIIALTATSFTVINQAGVAEGPIALGSGFASQVQIFSSAGVQIGDTLVISGGFSPATQGSYEITSVAAESLQFYSTASLPQESNIMTQAITIYSSAKNFVYLESDSKLSLVINGVTACNIEPFVIKNSTKPGVFMLKSTIFSLSVQNSGINSANIFFASIE